MVCYLYNAIVPDRPFLFFPLYRSIDNNHPLRPVTKFRTPMPQLITTSAMCIQVVVYFRGMIGIELLEWAIGQSMSVLQVKSTITTAKLKYLNGRNQGNG